MVHTPAASRLHMAAVFLWGESRVPHLGRGQLPYPAEVIRSWPCALRMLPASAILRPHLLCTITEELCTLGRVPSSLALSGGSSLAPACTGIHAHPSVTEQISPPPCYFLGLLPSWTLCSTTTSPCFLPIGQTTDPKMTSARANSVLSPAVPSTGTGQGCNTETQMVVEGKTKLRGWALTCGLRMWASVGCNRSVWINRPGPLGCQPSRQTQLPDESEENS